jgi:hypothetical protein
MKEIGRRIKDMEWAVRSMRMVIFIEESSRIICRKAMAFIIGRMEMYMMGSGKKERKMAKASGWAIMEIHMKGIGSADKHKGLELWGGLMGISMLVIGVQVRSMGKEKINMLMGITTRVSIWMGFLKGMASLPGRMAVIIKAFIKRERRRVKGSYLRRVKWMRQGGSYTRETSRMIRDMASVISNGQTKASIKESSISMSRGLIKVKCVGMMALFTLVNGLKENSVDGVHWRQAPTMISRQAISWIINSLETIKKIWWKRCKYS